MVTKERDGQIFTAKVQWGEEQRVFTFTAHVEDDGSAWAECEDGIYVSVKADEDAETLLTRASDAATLHAMS